MSWKYKENISKSNGKGFCELSNILPKPFNNVAYKY